MDEPRAEDEHAAIVELEVTAPPEEVWRALTTEEGLSGWLGRDATIDADPGGRVFAPDPVSGRPREGYVHTVDPGRELAYTWWPVDDPGDTTSVVIAVAPDGDGSLIRVTERPLIARAAAPGMVGVHHGQVRPKQHAEWQWRCAVLAVSSPAGANAHRVRA